MRYVIAGYVFVLTVLFLYAVQLAWRRRRLTRAVARVTGASLDAGPGAVDRTTTPSTAGEPTTPSTAGEPAAASTVEAPSEVAR